MREHDEQDELQDEVWELLGKARKPAADIRFTQNVMRAIREESSRPSLSWAWAFRFLVPSAIATGFAAVALAVAFWLNPPNPAALPLDEIAFEEIVNLNPPDEMPDEDFEVISDLDTLLASEENRLWIEDSSLF